jgi:uncharacterized protein
MPSKQRLSRTPSNVHVTERRMRFPFDREPPARHWAMDSAAISHFWSALSASFPPLEGFFITVVREYRSQVKDEKLRAELDIFVRQEGHHSRQHRELNRLLRQAGVPMPRYEAWFRSVLNAAERNLNSDTRLAMTVGLEHLTSVFASHYLTKTRPSGGAANAVDALWRWHAAEEIEHKAVCFDLFEAIGGTRLRRTVSLAAMLPLVLGLVFTAQFDLLRRDGLLTDPADAARAMQYMFANDGLLRRLGREVVRYLQPGFHPWQVDDHALIERWRAGTAAAQAA